MQTVRHELRTPVNHIIGFSEMLLEEASDLELPAHYGALQRVVDAGRQILAAITEILAGSGVAVRQSDLLALHSRITPYLGEITMVCAELIRIAEGEGRPQFAVDLRKIAGAADQLAQIASGATPLSTAPPLAEAQAEVAGRGPEQIGGSLLLVDDNDMNRDMFSRRLERLGYAITEARDGRPALDAMRATHFDLVLLDIMMPDMDGYAVLREMQADPELRHVPVIVLSALDDMASVVQAIELGADDYLPKPCDSVLLNARIGACLFKHHVRDMEVQYLRRIEHEKRRADDLLNIVIPIGVALSVEKDFNQLLERIVTEAQQLCNADGATLYLRTGDERLRFMIVRTRSLNIAMGGASSKDIPFPPLRLYDEHSGAPQHNYVVAHSALTGETINIVDAYNTEDYDFSGTRDFDTRTGYRSTSMLTIPLKDGFGRVAGVLQLINAQDEAGTVIAFDEFSAQMLRSLGTLAAAALAAYTREQELRQEISELRIEIDLVKKQREVEQITQSSYFGQLQERARQLRGTAAAAESSDATAHTGNQRRDRDRGSELQKKVYTIGGQEIHVREQGPPGRQTVVLIHGWSSSWYAMSPLLTMLSERSHCVAVDLPGYGESPPLRERATIAAYADLLAELIKEISPGQQVVLVGHSMGGMISVTMALRHTPLVERLVLICPTISGNLSFWINTFISPITMLERFPIASRVVALLEPYMLSVTDRLMRPASFADRTVISAADYARLRDDARRPGQGRVRAECFWAMRDNDLSDKLALVTTPSLVIWGMEDNTVPLRDASLVDDLLAGTDLQVLPRAGHWPQFESPERTQRHIRAFLGKPLKLLRVQL
ncbi:alpha/beta fold hydrolase [Oscillochloris sp. ZM17-4]|uniref:alpha/beta fold hydrolase n=1 Tax=Oscillochloris sp. ZM17-4 TaxID=2866714 RepID=UPI001C72FBD4|nr:alpha/beta fold hydrolase [Oscillochloris sp. ZM17-4]MBX0330121.1 alpha/beta fold hydrolase [Oscillochloris sp. ZM17-4]